jgi:putative ABC transport system permease protein
MVFWTIAYRNVKKNWRHSLSALLSLSASFVSLVLFDGYIDNLKQMYEDSFRHRSMLGDLKAGVAEPWKFSLFPPEQADIEAFFDKHRDLVNERVRFLNFQGMITNGAQSAIFLGRAYDVKQGEKVRGANWSWNATLGLPLHKSDLPNASLLGQGLAKKLGCTWPVDKSIYAFSGGYAPIERSFDCPTRDLQVSLMTAEGQLNALDVNVVGLMDAGYRDIDDRYFITSLESAQVLMNTKDVSMMSVELKSPDERERFVNLFNAEIGSKYKDIKIMTWVEHPAGETYIKTMDLMSVFRNFVVIVILIISTLSVINTLIKIIKERSREIGTLRSIGFTARQVRRMFFYETFLLALLGTFIGMVGAVVITLLLNISHIRYKAGMLSEPVLFKINIALNSYINAFLILTLVSLGACLFSTRQELKKKIVDNLNHV